MQYNYSIMYEIPQISITGIFHIYEFITHRMICFIRSYTYQNTYNMCLYYIYHWSPISTPFENPFWKGNFKLAYRMHTYIYHMDTYYVILRAVYTSIYNNRISILHVVCVRNTRPIAFTIVWLYTHHVAQT